MSDVTGKSGPPPPAPSVDIEEPTTGTPVDVDMGLVDVEVRAVGGIVLGVFAESYPDGGTPPAEPSEGLNAHPTKPGLFVGKIGAPCSENPPYDKFRIKAMAKFPAADPMDPEDVKVFDDDGVFEGKCTPPPGP